MRGWSLLGIATAASLAMLVRCLDPTEVRVVLTTDLDCSMFGEAQIVVGTPESLDTADPSATVDVCDPNSSPHALGDIVLTPGADRQAGVALKVVAARLGTNLSECGTKPRECIVARRALRYLPHTPLRLPIALDAACLGHACSVDQTCVEGVCKDAIIVDPSKCHDNGCDQSTLRDPPAPDPPTSVTAAPVAGGVVTTLAGSGNAAFVDGTGTMASFKGPEGMAVDGAGNVYVGDQTNNAIRKVTSVGVVTTLAGSDSRGYAEGTGTSARFDSPTGVAVDSAGNVYVADTTNNRIRKVTSAAVVTTLAGSGAANYQDGMGTSASFDAPLGVAVDGAGNVYVADTKNNRIRKITSAGAVTTLAGTGISGGDNGAGATATFDSPNEVAVDGAGTVYVSDYGNHWIRRVTSAGVVSTVGTVPTPRGVAVDGAGNLYVADKDNNQILEVRAGVTTTLAGSGAPGYMDGTGPLATFYSPIGVAIDGAGNLFVGDSSNNRIRQVTTGVGQLVVSWLGSASATGYAASASAMAQPTQGCSTTGATSCTIRGLTSGVAYSVTVTATNSGGASGPSIAVIATPN